MPDEPDKPTVAGVPWHVGAAVPALCLATGIHSSVCLDIITLFFNQTQAKYTFCRGIIHYARTFRKKRIFLTFKTLNALSERADIMNYVPTRAAFSFVQYVSFILFSSKQTADEPQ